MLHKMCHAQLSDADIKAICKSRGFSAREVGSRAIFENFFLSDIGVAAAMATLTDPELAMLHLLARLKDEVDVAFFARVYGDLRQVTSYYYNTYNQRFSDVMKQVQANLIRRGLLLYTEALPEDGTTTKLERLRFRLPVEFETFLPPLLPAAPASVDSGETRCEVLREKLLELAPGQRGAADEDRYALRIVGGELRIGQQPFRVELLQQWQQARWMAALGRPKGKAGQASPQEAIPEDARRHSLTFPEATRFICAQLGEGRWAPAEAITPLLATLCYGEPEVDGPTVCAAGWQWGCLARQQIAGQMCYRLPIEDPGTTDDDLARYLSPAPDGAAIINLETVAYKVLEQIARVSDLRQAGAGPYLIAKPNLIRLGRTTASLRRQPALQWLQTHAAAYREAFALAEERWGKQIIHTNLLVARITDPALRVQIERSLSGREDFIGLSEEFIAFPQAVLPAIERAVSKAGYVIKTVRGPDEK